MTVVSLRRAQALADGEHTGGSFHHETLFYNGADGFLAGTLPFIMEALANEEPVLVVVGSERIELLREALGGDSRAVNFADMHEVGRNPARIIPLWCEFLERHAPDGRPVLGIGEPVWSGRSPAELTECERHESLLNLAFDDGQGWRLLCPYDVVALDEQVIEAARCNHPFLFQDGESKTSDVYRNVRESQGPFEGALPEPLGWTQEVTFALDGLIELRGTVSRWAGDALLDSERIEHLALCVNELATNSVSYGGGTGVLKMWREDDTLICEVRDNGHIDQPLAGRSRPSSHQPSGRGLWLVNQLSDLVQIRSFPAGSVVRVHMRLS
jgi:anti-sigma regulatory factor (Ser/Thr protein kinase)